MNKTSKIIIGISIFVFAFLVIYSNIQANEAKKLKQESEKFYAENQVLKADAEELTARAVRLAADALAAQTNAENEAKRAMQKLEDCKGSK